MNTTPLSFQHFLRVEEKFGGDDDEDDLSFIFDDEEDDMLPKKERWVHQRIDWRLHCAQLIHEDRFHKEYRMSFQAWYIVLRPFDYIVQ